jgi:hypothetical protein
MAKPNRSGPATSPASTVTSIAWVVLVGEAMAVVVGAAVVVLLTATAVLVTIEVVDVDEVVVAISAPSLHAAIANTNPRSPASLFRIRRR